MGSQEDWGKGEKDFHFNIENYPFWTSGIFYSFIVY